MFVLYEHAISETSCTYVGIPIQWNCMANKQIISHTVILIYTFIIVL